MSRRVIVTSLIALTSLSVAAWAQETDETRWKAHDMTRPKPPRIAPVPQSLPAPAPEGAVILFDGTDLSAWSSGQSDARWQVEDGFFEVVPGTGTLRTREGFGDVQLHVEWAAPADGRGSGQDRGNSGVILMGGRYEIQVLDMHDNETYADGQAASVYGQYPPVFDASRPRGEWQAYDIYFRRPRFDADGELLEPARVTVVHNGVLVQNNVEFWGPTAWLRYRPYEAHEDSLPLELQDHGSRVRYRNIWALRVPELAAPPPDYGMGSTVTPSNEQLERLAGVYDRPGESSPIIITHANGRLFANFYARGGDLEMMPLSSKEFVLTETDGRIVFAPEEDGIPAGLTFHLGGVEMPATRRKG